MFQQKTASTNSIPSKSIKPGKTQVSRILKVQNIVQKIGKKKKQNLKAHTGSDEEVESFHGFTDSEIETASLKSGRSSVFSTSSRSKKQKILVKKPSLVKIQKRPKVDKKKKYKVPAAESDDEIESFTGFTDADIETASLKSGRSSIFSSSTASSKKSTISSISSSSKKSSLSSKSSGSKKSNASSISKKIKPSVKTVFNRNGTKMDIRKLKSKISGSKIDKETSATLKKHLKALYDSIYYWANADNILPIGVFMKLPCKKEYPDYYEVISKPIDMGIIETRIKTGHYKSGLEMVGDCKLMFSNCRMYNEEGSAIYEDANLLEKVLLAKAREIGALGGDRLKNVKKKTVSLQQKVKTLYDTLKDYRDAKGRQLSLIFLKLPSKHEYPDYYDIIKRPIDLEKISGKIRNNQYELLEDAVADFTLVFDNAAKYNEPDSVIYKDAQTLSRLCHQTVKHLMDDGDGVPDARAEVNEILNSIYVAMVTAQDAEERCLADSLLEVAEHDEVGGKKVRVLSLEIIKRRVDRGLYRRLDQLQVNEQ